MVSVIGDGALTGGPAFEALNNAAELQTNMIIVLNDNKMSISENVGGLSQHLASLRTAEAYQEFKSGVHNSLETSALRRTCGPQNSKDKEQSETAADSGHDF